MDNQNKKDTSKNKTQLYWIDTYKWTTNFFNKYSDLKIGAEVGIAGGQHIKYLMENTNIEKIYGIDPYEYSVWNVGVNVDNEYGSMDKLFYDVSEMLKHYDNRVELIRKKSLDASLNFKDESLDFVFIDAGHDYKDCLDDISFWHKKIRKGGFVMGHDWCHPAFPGVEQAVLEFYGDNVFGVPDPVHVWYVQK